MTPTKRRFSDKLPNREGKLLIPREAGAPLATKISTPIQEPINRSSESWQSVPPHNPSPAACYRKHWAEVGAKYFKELARQAEYAFRAQCQFQFAKCTKARQTFR